MCEQLTIAQVYMFLHLCVTYCGKVKTYDAQDSGYDKTPALCLRKNKN